MGSHRYGDGLQVCFSSGFRQAHRQKQLSREWGSDAAMQHTTGAAFFKFSFYWIINVRGTWYVVDYP